jgi:hypothetical protein
MKVIGVSTEAIAKELWLDVLTKTKDDTDLKGGKDHLAHDNLYCNHE